MSPENSDAISGSLIDVIRRAVFSLRSFQNVISLMALAVLGLPVCGCQSFQKQTTQKSAKCGELCLRAREAREKGNADKANEFINEALRQRPSDIETRRQLAETMWNNGRRSEAVSQLATLCELQPNDIRLATRLSVMQWETGQHEVAATTASSVLIRDPQILDAWRVKARHEVELGQLDEALVSYIRLSQLAPDDLLTLVELGDLYLKRGHPDRACPLFRAALQHPQGTSKQRADIEWLLGVAYARSERWSIAISLLETAIAERPASAEDWCFLGWNRLQCGDINGAQSDLQRALQCDTNSATAREFARQLDNSINSQSVSNLVAPVSHRELPFK